VTGHHDSILGRGKKMSLLQSLRTGSGKRPASYAVFPVVRQSGHEVDFSLPSNAKVEYNYTSSPPTFLHGVHSDSFTLLVFSWLSVF
jgi:hypothetical protein